ncbi:uncharacterized protein PHACADRAFT_210138 [Phanerochaete carnosa HHB-10118-sp]|uniref:Uncharacterized protein n=1 Tax=Phanerochaete carnosa (strain HHB-10118-sp) TaxID=650164 RepID=K5WV88_PHACS|nr:uncharacterized protein PHACADRAFT_210138 [Phanerochaete carnosa HHB-10118-sp]EKM54327.1 hypothetical protein PHACADRAFT_210138 [Phanerochaete carnosa HHB-10118-sp]
MPSTDLTKFPSPIGGIPLPRDLAPSVTFAFLFFLLVLLGVYRLLRRTSRSLLVITTLGFAVERVIIWSLRAKESRTPSEYSDRHLMTYWQVTFTVGYVILFVKLVIFLRCLVMNATEEVSSPDLRVLEEMQKPNNDSETQTKAFIEDAVVDVGDRTNIRRRYRRLSRAVFIIAILVLIIGVVSGNAYVKGETNRKKALLAQVLRQAAAVVSLALLLVLQGLLVYAHFTVGCIRRTPLILLFAVGGIIMIIPIYHLVVMGGLTTSLTSTERGSQNTSTEKIAFYVLQAVPEFLASGILLFPNVRTMFRANTGFDLLRHFRRGEPRAQ